MKKKIYYIFKENEQWYYWRWDDWSKMYFWGNPKFIVEALIKKHGLEKWRKVFDDFMDWIRSISDLKYINDWKIDTATFVLYRYEKDDNKESQSISGKEVQSNKEELTENGENSLT